MAPDEPDGQQEDDQEEREELHKGIAILSAFGTEVFAEFERDRKLSEQTKTRLRCLIVALSAVVEGASDQDD